MSTPSRQSAAAARRKAREQQILAATRQLFDESGVRDAQIDDIAKAVGINRAIIYRHFSGKEELFALAVEGYLEELKQRLETAAAEATGTPSDRLRAVVAAFVDFGLEYPAFVDCAQTLMRRPGPELLEQVSEGALFRLGRAISACLRTLKETLDAGIEAGDFKDQDSVLAANYMYASGLGALQLARIGMLVKESSPGIPAISPISGDQVKAFLTSTAVALATDR
ncbi:TetR/AcrR family transcriptional regulator [Nocardioides marmoriginsengisoli]|uniref:TetR/AcrR family transcriptional regulator n=1 Tax=Nocardioides marmoriginsengisoli TaxID=661483 RepID=A0A3N0CN11_9ACTN|nr:TetR/AcrR family transcriptional regulator [Nocardioides marmoriginsengisoli]RNL64848.1 TetR/AcrR family transcriptional regulator [Nocardioides marmoriginsengisoli]